MTNTSPIFVRPGQIQNLFGFSRATAYRWAAAGHLTIHKRGGISLFRTEEIMRYLGVLEGGLRDKNAIPKINHVKSNDDGA